jgi:hypothetical protein
MRPTKPSAAVVTMGRSRSNLVASTPTWRSVCFGLCWAILLLSGTLSGFAQAPISLTPGLALQGKIAVAAQNLYTFAGVSGAKVTITVSATTSGNSCTLNPQLQLYAPSGLLLTNVVGGCFSASPAEVANLTLPETGNYQVVCLGATATQSGGYVIALIQHPSGNQNDRIISAGQTLAGTISAGALDSYTFTGNFDERITVSMGAASSGNSCTVNPRVQLYAPDGTLITNVVGACFTGTPAEISNLALTQSGTYQIVCRGGNAVQNGAYTVALLQHPSTNQNDHAIVPGERVSSTLGAGALDSYTFAGAAGEAITISMGSTSSGNTCTLNPLIQLYGPDGTLVTNAVGGCFTGTPAELSNLTLTRKGTYQIVCRGGNTVQSGGYTLVLLQHPSGNQSDKAIAPGDRLTEALSAGALDTYTFFGAAGERVSISMGAATSGNTCTLNPLVQLYAPDATLLTNIVGGCFTGTPAALSNYSLPQTGTYQIVCRGGNAVQIGGYILSYLVLFPATPVLSWAAQAPIPYGTPLSPVQLSATSDVPGTFNYSLKDGTAINPGTTLNAGTYTLVATFSPTDATNYISGGTTETSLTISQAALTVAAPNLSVVYGSTALPFTPIFSGFTNGDKPSVITGAPVLGTSATPCSSVGSYPITCAQGTLAAANYSFKCLPGSLTITPAPAVLTVNNQSKAFGSTFPTGPGQKVGFTVTGLVCSDSVASVTLTSQGVAAAAPVGAYSIMASAPVGTGISNYIFDIVSGTLTVTNNVQVKVATPLISPNGGAFSAPVPVTLSCSTPGASIYYTLDGTDPTANAARYASPITLSNSATVKARGFVAGDNPSDVATAQFVIIVTAQAAAAPTITPDKGTYESSVLVTLSCATPGATIYYTLDGTDPTSVSSIYSSSFAVTRSATVKAKASAPTYTDSPIAAASLTVSHAVLSDFNGDGIPDLIFQDATDGFLKVWLMNTNGVAQSTQFLDPSSTGDPAWRLVDCGDFTGAGTPNLLFQYSDGSLAVWKMRGTNMISSEFLNPPNHGVTDWKAVATADFNKDGESDILFQSTTGDLVVWLMDDLSLLHAAPLNPINPGPGWKAVGAGDFNGDGNMDIVFQDASGTIAIWLLTNQTDLLLPLLANPSTTGDSNWAVVGVIDLNGDGKPDFLFQHQITGDLAAWYLDGTTMVRAILLTPSNPGGTWKLKVP